MYDFDKEEFRRTVYEIVHLIPRGRATSYGAIARAAGRPGYSRLAGRMMASSGGWDSDLPAHRVVNSQGALSGKDAFGLPGEMQRRLEAEGVSVAGDRIQNWKRIFWDPIKEL